MSDFVDAKKHIHEAERRTCAAELAGYLRAGQLVLLLGAGVSNGLGLPNWTELVDACEKSSGVSGATSNDLMRRMDSVRRLGSDEEFVTLVHRVLYEGLGGTNSYPDELLQKRMLIALGALTMSSVRGSVADVLTLNFDDVLDWYLHLHGFRTQVIHNLPVLHQGDVDVRIHHIHGFLPLMPLYKKSSWLLLTHNQLVERLSQSGGAPWPMFIGSQLQSKVLLAVGTSMGDTDLDVLFTRVGHAVGKSRPLGYVLNRKISDDDAAGMREMGLVPVSFDQHEDVPTFLLDVCQRAASEAGVDPEYS